MVGETYTHERQVDATLLDTFVTLVGTPSSSSALDSTCIQTFTSTYVWVYQDSPRLS